MAGKRRETVPGNRENGTGRRTNRLLGVLVLFLAFFLFAGYEIANLGPEEKIPSPPPEGTSSTPVAPDGGQPPTDRSWEEKTGRWRKTLQESSSVLRRDERGQRAAAGKDATGVVDLPSLDKAVRPGDLVDIVWQSSDGSLWKRVVDRPLEVREFTRGTARVAVTPEEARAIAEAQSEGRVFVAPH